MKQVACQEGRSQWKMTTTFLYFAGRDPFSFEGPHSSVFSDMKILSVWSGQIQIFPVFSGHSTAVSLPGGQTKSTAPVFWFHDRLGDVVYPLILLTQHIPYIVSLDSQLPFPWHTPLTSTWMGAVFFPQATPTHQRFNSSHLSIRFHLLP